MNGPVPHPSSTGSLHEWARQLYEYMQNQSLIAKQVTPEAVLLARMDGRSKATVDGLLLYDPVNDAVVCSIDGAFAVVYSPETVVNYTTAYNVDGATLSVGDNVVPFGTIELTTGTYTFNGYVTVVSDGSSADAIVCYIADTDDLTTPLGSVISGSITVPMIADYSVQVPVSGELTVSGTQTYSLVARSTGNSLSLGKAHGMTGISNRYASLTIKKVL